jgi:hypothetical protein
VAGEVDQAVELQVEHLPDPHAGGAKELQAGAGEDVVQPGDGAHQRPVGVRRQRPRHGLGQARDVGEEQQAPARRRCPAPVDDVLEEAAQVHDVLVVDDHADGPAAAARAAPGPGPCPGEIGLGVRGPVDLVKALDLGMVLGEVVEEHHQGLGPPGHGGGPQRGADRGHVAQDLGAYLRLGDLRGPLGRGSGGRPALARRDGHRAELVAGLPQREQALGEMPAG